MDKAVAEFSRNNGLITTETDKRSKSGNRLYEVKCRLCYHRCDEVFLCSRDNLLKHGVSCLCRGGKLSEKAWRVKLTDICSERGLVFLDFVGGFCGNRSKMSVLCDKHGPFTCVVSDLISSFKSRNCKSCSLLSRANKRTRPVQEIKVQPGTEIVGREGKDMLYRCEAELHGEIRILADQDYKGICHIEVQEIADEGDEEEWEEINSDGFFTVERKKFDDLDEAAVWLHNRYIGG